MQNQNKITQLREALLDELLKQVKEGTEVAARDGGTILVSPTSAILSVASKVVKDFADELQDNEELSKKAEKLVNYLDKRGTVVNFKRDA